MERNVGDIGYTVQADGAIVKVRIDEVIDSRTPSYNATPIKLIAGEKMYKGHFPVSCFSFYETLDQLKMSLINNINYKIDQLNTEIDNLARQRKLLGVVSE